jgi:hypothetical protein
MMGLGSGVPVGEPRSSFCRIGELLTPRDTSFRESVSVWLGESVTVVQVVWV